MTTPRVRVAIFVFDLSATGVVRNALALADGLAREHAVEIVTCRKGTMARLIDDVPIVTLGDGGRIGPAQLLGLGRKLRAYFRDTRPAIALSAGNRGHLLFLLALMRLAGLRRIYRFSNDVEHRRGARPKGFAKKLAHDVQMKALFAHADRIVLVSSHLASEPRLAHALATGQAVIIENGVDPDHIRRVAAQPCTHPFAAPGKPPFVLGIGRLVEQKNFPLLIEAVALANRTRHLDLAIFGEGTAAERSRLQALAAARGIGDRLHLPGVTDNPFACLARAAVFALPSWWEGASNVLLEALACGTPIVASATAGNAATVLDHGRYGAVIDPDDTAGWAAALLRQSGPAADRVLPGDRVEAYRLEDTLAAWRRLIAAELAMTQPA